MIDSLHIQNFKCLRDVKIDFAPLTVLIGANDSGKTSVLEALELLGKTAVAARADTLETFKYLSYRLGSAAPIWEVGARAGDEKFIYRLAAGRFHFDQLETKSVGFPGNAERIILVNTPLNQTQVRLANGTVTNMRFPIGLSRLGSTTLDQGIEESFRLYRQSLTTSTRYSLEPHALRRNAVVAANATLSPSGDNLAAVLDRLISGPDRSAVGELEAVLRREIPTLSGLANPPAPGGAQGEKTIEFVLAGKPQIRIPCALASDGAMLLTAYLCLVYGETDEILLIEEPENGIHPARLKTIIDFLRKITTGEIGPRPRQVILTTHSPLLLNYAKPEEVRIVQRDAEKGTFVNRLDKVPNVDELLQEFGVGELWYLLGEKALVEGQKP